MSCERKSQGLGYCTTSEGVKGWCRAGRADKCTDCVGMPGGWNEADREACCSGAISSSAACDPEWCLGNKKCDGTKAAIDKCTATTKSIATPECLDMCTREGKPAWCETAVRKFCKSNPSHDLCACISSDRESPECVDKKCHDTPGAFLTKAMVANLEAGGCRTKCGNINVEVTRSKIGRSQNNYIVCDTEGAEALDKQERNKTARVVLWSSVGAIAVIGVVVIVYLLTKGENENSEKDVE